MFKNKSKAFTMAEALIVMAILGFIAAIVIPTMKPAKFKEEGLKILAKKVLNEIDSGMTQIIINDSKYGKMTEIIDATGTFAYKDSADRILALFQKYIVTLRTDVPDDSFCKTGGTDPSMAATPVFLKNGACIGIKSGAYTANVDTYFPGETTAKGVQPSQGLILIDTNGADEPNAQFKDQFVIPIGDEGIEY